MTRRDFLAKTSAVGAAAAASPAFGLFSGQDTVKVGLIGCGGRGNGAARDCVESAPGVVLWAIGDVFADRVEGAKKSLAEGLGSAYQVGDRAFVGFDAYKSVVASGCDAVILTTPPGFRPAHLRAAVEAGKHVFMEKPVAVDAPGVRSVVESGEIADNKGLTIVAGTQRRYDNAYIECLRRVHDGQIGDITALYCYWNQGGLWMHPRKEGWTDVEWQLRNWLYFTALSGDIIVEQHMHNIDVCNWAMQSHPVKAISLGGRQARTDPAYGHVYDHFATEYEYGNGVKMVSMCRQIDGTASRVSEHVVGTRGRTNCCTSIEGPMAWRWEGDRPNPYVVEHTRMIESLRGGKRINEARQVAHTTMTAILGRMAAYSGAEVTWDAAYGSEVSLLPELNEFGEMPVPDVAIPGKTRAW